MTVFSPRRVLLATAMALCSGTAFAGTSYSYTAIIVPNSVYTTVSGINASGTVIGQWYDETFTEHGFLYQNGTVTSLDDPNAVNGTGPTGIDAKGEVVGYYYDENYAEHGFTYSAAGVFTTLDMPGTNGTGLVGIDSKGVIYGLASGSGNAQIVFSYAKKTFTTLPISGSPVILTVSDKGSLAGFFFTSPFTALLYADGTATTLPLNAPGGAEAFGVNSKNTVVGVTNDASYVSSGFIYANGTATTVTAPGAASTQLTGINDAGLVVGTMTDSSNNETAFSYKKGKFTTISVPGGSYTTAVAVNKMGQVTGTYNDANGQEAYVATPVK